MDRVEQFEEKVRKEISGILSQNYRTLRHGGHKLDKDESLKERKFWPDMIFHGVELGRVAGRPIITLTFTPVYETSHVYGFRIDLDKAVDAWAKRVGILKPREHPSMFAAELIWYMVTYIGAVDITQSPADADGVRWINTGSDIFERLPGIEDHHHA